MAPRLTASLGARGRPSFFTGYSPEYVPFWKSTKFGGVRPSMTVTSASTMSPEYVPLWKSTRFGAACSVCAARPISMVDSTVSGVEIMAETPQIAATAILAMIPTASRLFMLLLLAPISDFPALFLRMLIFVIVCSFRFFRPIPSHLGRLQIIVKA